MEMDLKVRDSTLKYLRQSVTEAKSLYDEDKEQPSENAPAGIDAGFDNLLTAQRAKKRQWQESSDVEDPDSDASQPVSSPTRGRRHRSSAYERRQEDEDEGFTRIDDVSQTVESNTNPEPEGPSQSTQATNASSSSLSSLTSLLKPVSIPPTQSYLSSVPTPPAYLPDTFLLQNVPLPKSIRKPTSTQTQARTNRTPNKAPSVKPSKIGKSIAQGRAHYIVRNKGPGLPALVDIPITRKATYKSWLQLTGAQHGVMTWLSIIRQKDGKEVTIESEAKMISTEEEWRKAHNELLGMAAGIKVELELFRTAEEPTSS